MFNVALAFLSIRKKFNTSGLKWCDFGVNISMFLIQKITFKTKWCQGVYKTIVKLLGVKPIEKLENKAVEFLKDKFKKRKIFLKYDSIKYDSDNKLLCYVYLDNKTFINRHLIRTGFVSVDDSFDYKYKSKFLEATKNG